MIKYEPGEIVDITIKGARVREFRENDGPGTRNLIVTVEDDATEDEVTVNPDNAFVAVQRVTPTEWPPQPGDLWADGDDREWFTRQHECGDVDCRSDVELVDDRGTSHHYLSPVPVALAPLTLLRRKSSAVES